jgi:uncharacterized membrane protein YfcA
MKRIAFAALALIFVIGWQPQSARAANSSAACSNGFLSWLAHGQDCHLFWGGAGIGIGTGVAGYFLTKKHGYPKTQPVTAGVAYGITTYACAVAYPFVATVLLNRPLTPREMYIGVAECIVPFVGGWLVDTYLPHDAWTDGTPVKKVAAH